MTPLRRRDTVFAISAIFWLASFGLSHGALAAISAAIMIVAAFAFGRSLENRILNAEHLCNLQHIHDEIDVGSKQFKARHEILERQVSAMALVGTAAIDLCTAWKQAEDPEDLAPHMPDLCQRVQTMLDRIKYTNTAGHA